MRRATQGTGRALPPDLTEAITRAGYYPSLVCDVVESAIADDEVVSHLVHQETTFDHETV
ncbi:MAG: phosphodiesterase, partial [Dermatophilaceae bacterium]|nr:phosphodiesterase [Dermatophilaceae bacterium]